MKTFERRRFLQGILGLSAMASTSCATSRSGTAVAGNHPSRAAGKLKLSLNSYSFNDPLRNGSMSVEALLQFCADQGFDAVDLTGYYFPGYPAVPSDEYIYKIKNKAFRLGLDISGTGIRNDFSIADPAKRKEEVNLVKKWIVAAAKMGAPVIRIFAGNNIPAGYSWQQAATWIIDDIKNCAAFGAQHGVIVAMQNHNDFVKTADEAEIILKAVDSPWFGLVLDIGSYRGPNPYEEIKRTAKYAVNWQLKENMYFDNVERKTDVEKVIGLIKASGYRGYIPIETLGAGDPKVKVPVYLAEVRNALHKNGM